MDLQDPTCSEENAGSNAVGALDQTAETRIATPGLVRCAMRVWDNHLKGKEIRFEWQCQPTRACGHTGPDVELPSGVKLCAECAATYRPPGAGRASSRSTP